MGFKTFPLRLSLELHKKLKVAAARSGVTLQEYCVRVLADHVLKVSK
jgi:predicted HicB family RNase H-like nuclease